MGQTVSSTPLQLAQEYFPEALDAMFPPPPPGSLLPGPFSGLSEVAEAEIKSATVDPSEAQPPSTPPATSPPTAQSTAHSKAQSTTQATATQSTSTPVDGTTPGISSPSYRHPRPKRRLASLSPISAIPSFTSNLVGLSMGSQGSDVVRLQALLMAEGYEVDEGSIQRQSFSQSTATALRKFQANHHLKETGEVDGHTAQLLYTMRLIYGQLVDGDGDPVLDRWQLQLIRKAFRGEKVLQHGVTHRGGQFAFALSHLGPLNLMVRASDGKRGHAVSTVLYDITEDALIPITTAKDGVVRSPSVLTFLIAQLQDQLDGVSLATLASEATVVQDMSFLNSSTNASFSNIGYLLVATALAKQHGLMYQTLFGLFYQGLPKSLKTALASPSTLSLNASFLNSTFTSLLSVSDDQLNTALTNSVTNNILPASYLPSQVAQLTLLENLRTSTVPTVVFGGGTSTLADVLSAGGVSSTATTAFYNAYASSGSQLADTLTTLSTSGSVSAADLTAIGQTLSLSSLFTGSVPLIKDTIARLQGSSPITIQSLALLQVSDWVTRITAVDPTAASVPPTIIGGTAQARIAAFAQSLTTTLAARYPTMAFVGNLTSAQSSSFSTHTEIATFLTAHPTLELVNTNVDYFLLTSAASQPSSEALVDLKTAQRLMRLAPDFTHVDALNAAQYTSAQNVYFTGRAAFLQQMTSTLGADQAALIFAKSQMTYGTAVVTFAKFNQAFKGPTLQVTPSSQPSSTTTTGLPISGLPDIQSLFGNQDYFQCDDCQSVLSPAAYLVDLLQYLNQFTATVLPSTPSTFWSTVPAGSRTAQLAVLTRRPDIGTIALDCSNTDITLPYIDVVNEILEDYISTPSPAITIRDTTGTSVERRAIPQRVNLLAYIKTNDAIFPLTLPFNLNFAQTQAFLNALKFPLATIMALFVGSPGGPTAADVACATLGVNEAMGKIITTADPPSPWLLWGFSNKNPDPVFDPTTREPIPAGSLWSDVLARVPILLNRANLTLQQLYQLLEVQWVCAGKVTLSLGLTMGIVSPSTEKMTFTELTGDVLTKANRFLRLLSFSGLQMWELDWALQENPGQKLNSDFMIFLVNAQAVQTALSLPFQETLTLWNPMETRDVTDHLTDEDTVTPSTYTSVFANATMQLSWATQFPVPPSPLPTGWDLSGTSFIADVGVAPTVAQTAILNAITAALGLSASDISAILTAYLPSPYLLNLATLKVLFCMQRLSTALTLSVVDLILWIQLTGIVPFGAQPSVTPGSTQEFLRRLGVLQGVGLAVSDLDYLLRSSSADQSSLTLTETQATALLQQIHDGIVPLNSIQQMDPNIQSNLLVQCIAAACNVNPLAVGPLITPLGSPPLSPATIKLLTSMTTVDATQFPTLIAAFTLIARGCALFNALSISTTEWPFIVANAGAFNWLDPSNLPTSTTSPYTQFEALLRVIQLNHRQTTRGIKLFDVFTAWQKTTPLPTVAMAIKGDVPSNLPSLATALNGSAFDLLHFAAKLHVTPPVFGPPITVLTGSLCDVAMLTRLASLLDYLKQYLITSAALVDLSGPIISLITASTAMGAFQAQFPQSKWLSAVQGVEDGLRTARRDALVAYLLGPGFDTGTGFYFLTTDDLFDFFLIDPEMCPCGITTRLLQPSLAIQQFVQQCFLNLTIQVSIDMSSTGMTTGWGEWSWRQQYRLWQANREIFLWPENYVFPELRTNETELFDALESDLQQQSLDEDVAEAALQNYLRGLLEVSRLVVGASYSMYDSTTGEQVLYVFGHTRASPPIWYYRTRSTLNPVTIAPPPAPMAPKIAIVKRANVATAAATAAKANIAKTATATTVKDPNDAAAAPNAEETSEEFVDEAPLHYPGTWTPWVKLNLDIGAAEHVFPVVWDSRLHLCWTQWKQKSESQKAQSTPDPTSKSNPPQPPPSKYWAVEVSMSEFSAGVWQPKVTINEKFYFQKTWTLSDLTAANDLWSWPPSAFQFSAFQDPNPTFNLIINVTFLGQITVGIGTLSMPESAMIIQQDSAITPIYTAVDITQEPTYALIFQSSPLDPYPVSLPSPTGENYLGQDLIANGSIPLLSWMFPLNQPDPVYVTDNYGGPAELLRMSYTPHIIFSQNPQYNANPSQNPQTNPFLAAPFFFSDGGSDQATLPSLGITPRPPRFFLLDPAYVDTRDDSDSSDSLAASVNTTPGWVFTTFYHPYARVFLRELEIGGVPQLMARSLQINPQKVRGWLTNPTFVDNFNPTSAVALPYPSEAKLDFLPGYTGAMSEYNWEVFYHNPMYISSQLKQNSLYQEAMTWLEYIFNPTDTSTYPVPARFWNTAPLFQVFHKKYLDEQITTILTKLEQNGDPSTAQAIQQWMANPFDADAVASLRPAAYGLATVQRFLDNLIAWGDSLFAQYTSETVAQAEQLYILADLILGPQPQQIRPPASYTKTEAKTTWNTISGTLKLDMYGWDALVAVENLIIAPQPTAGMIGGTKGRGGSLPPFPGKGQTLFFCIPPNAQLLAYWPTVAQRLYNIRHCLNLQGVYVPLPLYAPPINPLLAEEEAAAGLSPGGSSVIAPVYRFSTYMQRAIDMCNDLRSYGSLILSALEKKDAETLATMRANQDLDIQTRMLDVKTAQVQEAQDNITALNNQLAVTQVRVDYYTNVAFINAWEVTALGLQALAMISNAGAMILDIGAGIAHPLPNLFGGVAGFGGSPAVQIMDGGDNIGQACSAWAQVARDVAGLLGEQAGMVGTLGSYQRRQDEWTLQLNIANAEVTQINSQIIAANDRLTAANTELNIQNVQISNAQKVSDFLTNKFTNADLYNWMVTQLTQSYTSAYQLTMSLAQQAQNAYAYELGVYQPGAPALPFIQPTYFDIAHKGLTAGDLLLLDLKRMENQYLTNNVRELELTKHISLALTQPIALVQLRETGICQVFLNETLFDSDNPGHYFRRIRSVAVTIPCVTGPYTSVNATLTLNTAVTRFNADMTDPVYSGGVYGPVSLSSASSSGGLADPLWTTTPAQSIATSSGQNDSGMFDPNLKDERWLPFEGFGAVSAWTLQMNQANNNFDFSSVSDVILHLRYTARQGSPTFQVAVQKALAPTTLTRALMISARHTFSTSYYQLFHPTSVTATSLSMTLPLTTFSFPYFNFGSPLITQITVFFALAKPLPNNSSLSINATLYPTSAGAAGQLAVPLTIKPTDPNWTTPPSGLAYTAPAPQFLTGVFSQFFTSPAKGLPAQSMTMTIAMSDLPSPPAPGATPGLTLSVNGQTLLNPAAFLDIIMVVQYLIQP